MGVNVSPDQLLGVGERLAMEVGSRHVAQILQAIRQIGGLGEFDQVRAAQLEVFQLAKGEAARGEHERSGQRPTTLHVAFDHTESAAQTIGIGKNLTQAFGQLIRRAKGRPDEYDTRGLSSRTVNEFAKILVECQKEAVLIDSGLQHRFIRSPWHGLNHPRYILSGLPQRHNGAQRDVFVCQDQHHPACNGKTCSLRNRVVA
jgi:hypothetical protein